MKPHQEMLSPGHAPAGVLERGGEPGRLKKWAFRVDPSEGPATAGLRTLLRVCFIMLHEASETAILLRASALTYSIVLSMVPVLAMSTAVLKGLGSDNQLKVAAYRFIDQLEPDNSAVPDMGSSTEATSLAPDTDASPPPSPPPATASPPTAETVPGGQATLTSHLRNAVDTIFDYVDRTNFAALGAFGIAGLVLAVILVLSTIENAMNAIWHTRKGRSIFRKVMDYLALLILLPVSINVALAGDAILESPKILAYLHTVIPSEWATRMLLKLLPFLIVILTLMVMYQFFPNVRVKTHAAFAGALFAGFFWFVVQRGYIVLQIGVAKYNAIYGSFATVPLFLIWIHLGWTFILLGATLAYAVQNRHQYHIPGTPVSPQRNLQLAFDILNTVYENFLARHPTSLDDLALANPGDSPGNIREITGQLVEGGLLLRTENDRTRYVPAAPPEKIEAAEVVRLILGNEEIPTTGGRFAGEIIKKAEQAIPADAFPMLTDSPSHPPGRETGRPESVDSAGITTPAQGTADTGGTSNHRETEEQHTS
ncbi:MAG: YihY/virulence factor BrkB family protein [Desulfobulbaceae bacterium]